MTPVLIISCIEIFYFIIIIKRLRLKKGVSFKSPFFPLPYLSPDMKMTPNTET